MSKFHEKYARRHLNRLREQQPLGDRPFWFDATASTLSRWLEDGDLNLKSIGSSEEELAELRVRFWTKQAKSGLEKIRNLTACNRDIVYGPLEKAGKTLADIGTSEEELDLLDVEYCKRKALHFLNEARNNPYFSAKYKWVDAARKFLNRGKLTPQDVGTSEEEMSLLAV